MSISLHILIVEDSEDDAILLMRTLQNSGYELTFERVEIAEKMSDALNRKKWDIIIADYTMPHFSGLEALKLLQKSGLDIPFIIISGAVGEEIAVEAIKAGANDYLMKDNLHRLIPTIQRELRETKMRLEHKQAKEGLHQLDKAIETISLGVTIANIQGEIIYTNPAEAKIHGYTMEELIGKNIGIFAPNKLRKQINIEQIKKWKGLTRESINFKKDGSTFPVQLTSNIITDTKGNPITIITICEDITERKKIEEVLKKYKFMIESANDAIFFKDLESRYIIINNKTLEVFGLSREEVIGKNDYELMSNKEEAQRNIENDQSIFKTLNNKEIIKCMTRTDGKEYWFHTIKVPQFDDKGNVIGVVGIARDITEHKKIEKTLKKRNEELERFNKITIDRELKMIELKKKINILLEELGKEPKYKIAGES